MSYFCRDCKHTTEKSPCEHCGSTTVAYVLRLDADTRIEFIPSDKPDKSTKLFDSPTLPPAIEFTFELTPEQAEKLERMLPKFDISRFIGIPCAVCGEPFTQAFFDAGGTVIRASDDRWQHDHCASQN